MKGVQFNQIIFFRTKSHCAEKSQGGPLCSPNPLFLLKIKGVLRFEKVLGKSRIVLKKPKGGRFGLPSTFASKNFLV